MKTIIAIIAGMFLYGSVIAQEKDAVRPPNPDSESITYCAVLKDGKMIIMSEGKQVYQDIALENGHTIRSNAILVNDEGKETALINGDCVGLDGKIIAKPEKSKPEKINY